MVLFIGDDWAEDHHDVEFMNTDGRTLAKARLPEGVAGIARLHAMAGEQLDDDSADEEILVGIETDLGPWVAALIAAGYTAYAINSLQVARYRQRRSVSGAKSDAADAHTIADMAAPTLTSCARSPVTPHKQRRSRCSRVLTSS